MNEERSERDLFNKILIANRGEIALRVMRACRDLGIPSVAVYGEDELHAPHVRYADEAYRLDSDAPIPYLDIEAILEVARASGAAAIHPGYGFLSENATFARACADAGVTFIGPSAEAMAEMGDKIRAREIARNAGVPLIPGSAGAIDPGDVEGIAGEIGYPVAIKAAAGGGGRGFRVAWQPDELADAVSGATGEAERYFSDGRVFVERYLEAPRHVEIQILADAGGTTLALGERDCSIQRRHQKLVEESPSPALNDGLRAQMEAAAVELARAVGYVSAGTVEFMVQGDEFFFLEMNTRIQVEHPVTEMVTGVDLVVEQIRIAAGATIDPELSTTRFGHAIECRINAEDVTANFQPVSGPIGDCVVPSGPGVRFDGAVESGGEVSPRYDSLLGKLVTWGATREQAIGRMRRALDELQISEIATTAGFHRQVMDHEVFASGAYDTRFLEHYPEVANVAGRVAVSDGGPGSARDGGPAELIHLEVNGKRFEVRLFPTSRPGSRRQPPKLHQNSRSATVAPEGSETIVSPIQGTVLSVAVAAGETIKAGDVICVVEAMKMENEISAGRDGTVSELNVSPGETIQSGAVVAIIGSGDPPSTDRSS